MRVKLNDASAGPQVSGPGKEEFLKYVNVCDHWEQGIIIQHEPHPKIINEEKKEADQI